MLHSRALSAALVAAFCPFVALAAAETKVDYTLPLIPENVAIGHYPPAKAPILTVKSGATVKIEGGGGARWGDQAIDAWLKENNVPTTAAECPALAETARVLKEVKRAEGIPSGHLLVGPIAIEGAEPGDSLEVRILSVVPRIPYGTVSTVPGKGGIPDLVPRPWTRVVMLDLKRNVGIFEPGIEVPLRPFMGVMATCPAEAEGPLRKSGPPGLFGGNLDCKELVGGTTLYLPVFRSGALFYTGDSHAGQGDGEVTVSAIETANTCTLQFILHKGKTLKAPRAETPTHFMTFGLDEDLDKAMRMAITETNAFLGELKGLDFFRAFTLSSIAVDFRVTQVVDGTQGVHAMIPKKIFVNDHFAYWAEPKSTSTPETYVTTAQP